MADWKQQLSRLVKHVDRKSSEHVLTQPQVEAFIRETATPALEEVAQELERQGRNVHLEGGDSFVQLTVLREGEEEFAYAVRARTLHKPGFALVGLSPRADDTYQRAEVYLNGKAQDHGIGRYSREQVIHHFLHEYGQYLRWQTPRPSEPEH